MPAQARRHRILAHPSRAALVPPTGFDWDAASRLAADVPASLELEHVHGYESVRNSAPNLFYTSTGRIVHYAAALGIVTDVSCIIGLEKRLLAAPADHIAVSEPFSKPIPCAMPEARVISSEAWGSHADDDRRRTEGQDIRDDSHGVSSVAAENTIASEHIGVRIAASSEQDQSTSVISPSESSAAPMRASESGSSAHSGTSIAVCNALNYCVQDAAASDLSLIHI